MPKRKPVPQTFSEREYNAIVEAFRFVEHATSRPNASTFDFRCGAELRAIYSDMLPKLGYATYGKPDDE